MKDMIVDPAEWAGCLAHHPNADVFHQYAYVAVEADRQQGVPALITVLADGERVSLVLIIRPIPGHSGLYDATSVYGYNGVLESVRGAASKPELIARLASTLLGLGIICVFNRGHPFLEATLPSTCVTGQTLAISLRQGADQYERNLSKSHRYEIRKLAAMVRCESDPTIRHLESFHRIYSDTMSRCGANSSYFFSPEYLAKLFKSGGEGASMELAWVGERLAAAAIFFRHGQYVHYHLSGSDPHACKYPATKMLIDNVVRAEIAAGRSSWLHLGGGVGSSQDSLYDFKAGFGSIPIPFKLTRWVVNPVEYAKICALNPKSEQTAFFPAYRA